MQPKFGVANVSALFSNHKTNPQIFSDTITDYSFQGDGITSERKMGVKIYLYI